MVAIMTDRTSPSPSAPSGPSDPSDPAAGALNTAPPRRPLRQLLAASVGNAVEWYDWYAYTFLATYIAGQVFPKGSGNSSYRCSPRSRCSPSGSSCGRSAGSSWERSPTGTAAGPR